MAAQGRSAAVLVMIACFLSVSGEQVPDGVVYTDLHKTVERGNEIILKCKFHKDPVGVYWMKEDDPDQSYNLISWVEGTFLSGSCLSTKRCELDENDYSLIIRDAQIADRGRYICRVSNYLGILIRNYTDVDIFAPPNKPYPVIKQCVEAEPNGVNSNEMCAISSDNPISITCMALGFFPDLELFFLHGSKRITTIDSNEWTNDDGTKSKFISIKGSPSEAPYVCVASFIPGRSDQETATVLINLLPDPALGSREPPDPETHTPKRNENTPSDNKIAKIVVPVLLFVVAGIGMLLAYLWRRHQQRRDEPEANDIEEAERMVEIKRINVLGPGHSNEPLDLQKVKVLLRKLTSRHWRQMANCVGVDDEATISRILDENYGVLFDTESMISEWIEEKRCSLNDVLHIIGGLDMAVHKTNFTLSDFNDAEFGRIATYLSSSQLKEVFGDGDDPAELVRAFVEDWMAKTKKKQHRDTLRNKLQTVGCAGLVPYKQKSKVYLCELLDVAFRLLLEDVYPMTKALGISGEILKKYRIDYTPHHLTKGTTAALIKFSEGNNHDRRKVCEALSNGGYRYIALLLEYGHEVSLADEFAVVSKAEDIRDAFPKISRNLGISDRGNTETFIRDWKVMVHPPSYNHRTSLADAVCPILGVDLAAAILSGKYREHDSESAEVIHRIISGIESFEESLIAKILGVDDKLPQQEVITHSHSIDQTDEDRDFNSEGEVGEVAVHVSESSKSALALTLAEILGVTVKQQSPAQYTSIRQVLETWEEKLRENPLNKDDRRELSNNLLRTGFKEFAFEIMTGFLPGPADKGSNRGGDNAEDKVAGNSNREQVGEDNRRETENDNGEQVSEEQAQQ